MPSDPVTRLGKALKEATAAVIFTGAGMSTESGIPDFRSPGGLWDRYRPIDFAEFLSSEEARRESWRRRFAMSSVLDVARPNGGHAFVAELVRRERVKVVITQNIDELHQASGVPSDRVIELHGSTMYGKCLGCERRFEIADVKRRFDANGASPRCDGCNGFVKTATISFGQSLPVLAMELAGSAAVSCDLFVVLGSSLVVYPAASLPELAKRRGATLAIVNREPTDLDGIADIVIHGEIGKTLEGVAMHVRAN